MFDTPLTRNHFSYQPLVPNVSLFQRKTSESELPLQVAVYCRVSTDLKEQKHSYHLQMNYYTAYVKKQKGWKLYRIFADEGLSGTSRKKRTAFNQMMDDAMNGKFHYIITKSISRFARNTLDTLHCIRSLKSLRPPVGVYFEKENIDTLDTKSELLLTILSALAQDESRSISDNVRWSIQKKFQNGIDVTNLSSMIGYEFGPDKEWKINESQAKVVRYIYQRYLDGLSYAAIAKELMNLGYVTGRGNTVWRGEAVRRILMNEKYVGDTHLQKTMTKDLFNHQSIPNDGTLPSYYIRNHHPAIIDRATWEAVQAEQARRSKTSSQDKSNAQQYVGKYSGKCIFSSKLFCGNCSELLIRRTFRLTRNSQTFSKALDNKVSYPVWRCRTAEHLNPPYECHAKSYLEISLKQSFMEYLYQLKRQFLSCMNSPSFSASKPDTFCASFSSFPLMQEFTSVFQTARSGNNGSLKHSASFLLQNFRWFLTELVSLPDHAADGSPFQILSPYKESLAHKDILPFASHIFQKMVVKGTVLDDLILYETKFGVCLAVEGNQRRLRDFCGFRIVHTDGSVQILSNPEEVAMLAG